MDPTSINSTIILDSNWLNHIPIDKIIEIAFSYFLHVLSTFYSDETFSNPSSY
uniref:Uncharacterized protein n=1 Tax=Arundo donax TaxID=35708 RepID=A0A0A9BMI8_ARUDO